MRYSRNEAEEGCLNPSRLHELSKEMVHVSLRPPFYDSVAHIARRSWACLAKCRASPTYAEGYIVHLALLPPCHAFQIPYCYFL